MLRPLTARRASPEDAVPERWRDSPGQATTERGTAAAVLRSRAVRAEQQHPHRVSPVLRKDCRARPEAPALSSTTARTATKETLDPIIPDEQESGVQVLIGMIFFSHLGAGLGLALRNETGRKFVKEHRNRGAGFCVLQPSPLEVFMTAAVRFVSLAVCFVVVAGCDIVEVVAQSERARGSFERTLTVDGPVDLNVRSGSGGIQIRTGSGDRVQVIGKVSAGSSRDGLDPAERVRKVEAAPPITQQGNVIRIGDTNDDPTYRNISISYEIVVPANTRLDAQTGSGNQTIGSVNGAVRAQTGSGSIHIERTGGSLFAQTGSGNIDADAVGGDVRAQTGSGSVEVRQTTRGDVSVQTGSGSVRLSLPEDASYTLDAQTGSGSISTAHPLTVQGQTRRNHLTGTVRGGGNAVRVRTGSGSIDIR